MVEPLPLPLKEQTETAPQEGERSASHSTAAPERQFQLLLLRPDLFWKRSPLLLLHWLEHCRSPFASPVGSSSSSSLVAAPWESLEALVVPQELPPRPATLLQRGAFPRAGGLSSCS